MHLTNQFNTLVLSGLLALSTLTGCAKKIGAADSPADLKGTTTTETLEGGAVQMKCIHLDGRHLEKGTSYKFNNASLTIDGDVPPGTSIEGENGQLVITGNVGDKASLEVNVPEYTHEESYTYLMPMYGSNGNGGMTIIGYMPATGYNTIEDGPQPPFDKTPTVVVKGHVGKDVSFPGSKGTSYSVNGR